MEEAERVRGEEKEAVLTSSLFLLPERKEGNRCLNELQFSEKKKVTSFGFFIASFLKKGERERERQSPFQTKSIVHIYIFRYYRAS